MRLEGRIKMGYYPTPPSVVERIKTFIKITDGATILDPCCGEGNALKQLAEGTTAQTYGVEIDGHRAEEAVTKLHRVLKCGIEQTRISNGTFSCLFLNPPYDWETQNDDNERKEKTFLKETLKYLQSNGVLIYIIPQNRLDKSTAKILAYRFQNIQAYKFPQEEYEAFKQIVLFAVKKKQPNVDEDILSKLIKVRYAKLEELPNQDQPSYELPRTKTINLFQSTVINEKELEKEVMESPLWKRFEEMTRVEEQRIARPPLPLHTGHLGLLLANGCLDGRVGRGEDMHIVRGKVEKTVAKYSELKGDVLEERELDQYKVTIKILRQDGEIITLM
jgi:tRNA1(Val) A37 N6-methylase TrmN6